VEFEWDENKRLANLAKHGLDFEDVRPCLKAGLRFLQLTGSNWLKSG